MMLPGKQPAAPAVEHVWPLLGSRTRIAEPFGFTLCEKLHCRSSAVGMVYLFRAVAWVFHNWSHEKKKNRRFLFRLKGTFGIQSGPPTVPPGFSYRYRGFCTFSSLLKNSLALNSSCR